QTSRRLPGRGQNLVQVTALPDDLHVSTGFSLESLGGLGDDFALGLVGVPHGPHGEGHALVLLALGTSLSGSLGLSRCSGGDVCGSSYRSGSSAAGSHTQDHHNSQQHCNNLLHGFSSIKILFWRVPIGNPPL